MTEITPLHILWLSEDREEFFLIPEGLLLMPGMKEIQDLEGNSRFVGPDALRAYGVRREQAELHLREEWDAAVVAAKKAYENLTLFAGPVDFEAEGSEGEEESSALPGADILTEMMQGKDGEMGEGFQKMLEELEEGQGMMGNLNQLFSAEDHEGVMKTAMEHVSGIIEKMDGDALKIAGDDPDAWADAMYQQLFAEEIKDKEVKGKAELETDIDASIAAGIREVGMTPSVDWEEE